MSEIRRKAQTHKHVVDTQKSTVALASAVSSPIYDQIKVWAQVEAETIVRKLLAMRTSVEAQLMSQEFHNLRGQLAVYQRLLDAPLYARAEADAASKRFAELQTKEKLSNEG